MSTPVAELRRANERLVFEQLRSAGPASRAQLAKAVGLSAPTVGKVAETLVDSGLLEEDDASVAPDEPVLGRPSRPLRLSRRQHRIIALQIGVRHTRVAALPIAGPLDDQPEQSWPVQFATPSEARPWITQLKAAAKKLHVPSPWAVAVSVPGVVDESAGRVLLSPNLRWLESLDLLSIVQGLWSSPAILVQEIRALALGHVAEASSKDRDFLLVDVGEGVGGAVIAGGRLQVGALPMSGELGHTPIFGNTRKCGCGAIGCVETLASRNGLMQSWRQHAKPGGRTWSALVAHVNERGIEPWLGEALDALGCTIGGAMNVLGLRHAVVTGVPGEFQGGVMDRLRAAVERSTMWARFGTVRCEAAPRRRAAGLVSAAIDRVLLPAAESPLRIAAQGEPR
jgi:predicted NBD/HSP70 family sugar kinase